MRRVELTILRAQPADADALTVIAVAAKRHWNYPERWIEYWRPQLTISAKHIDEHDTWMAAVNDAPVAFYSLKMADGFLWLDHLWVLPEFMRQGIGAFLFRHALGRSRRRGVSVLRVESDPNAQGFYEKYGAVKVGEIASEVDGQPRILPMMEIAL